MRCKISNRLNSALKNLLRIILRGNILNVLFNRKQHSHGLIVFEEFQAGINRNFVSTKSPLAHDEVNGFFEGRNKL